MHAPDRRDQRYRILTDAISYLERKDSLNLLPKLHNKEASNLINPNSAASMADCVFRTWSLSYQSRMAATVNGNIRQTPRTVAL